MEEIDEQNWEYAHRLFQCVAAASRPLRAEELAEFLAFDFDAGSTPEFLASWRSEDPEHEVLSICSTLLVVVKPLFSPPVIQFAHFSVQEYLTSARLAKTKDTVSRFHVSITLAHTIVAKACLGVLLHFDETIIRDRLEDFPLVKYAATHWFDHARFENVSSKVEDGMKRLFDPRKMHFAIWVWIYNPEHPRRLWRRFERRVAAKTKPLHYAAFCGLHDVVTFLIVEHSQDVNARSFRRWETPLLVAVRMGHVEIAQLLLKHGADTEARDTAYNSPLEMVTVKGQVELAQVLLEHGADANVQDKERCTPLYWASQFGQLAVAQVLLSHGADVTAQCMYNQTPLHLAKDEEVARLLLEHGADANALDINHRTPLHYVSGLGRMGLTQFLLERGADANARDTNNSTPLHSACNPVYKCYIFGDVEYLGIVRLLLEYNSDVHARDDEGQTPFMRAMAEGRDNIMQLLLEHGADDHRV